MLKLTSFQTGNKIQMFKLVHRKVTNRHAKLHTYKATNFQTNRLSNQQTFEQQTCKPPNFQINKLSNQRTFNPKNFQTNKLSKPQNFKPTKF